MELDTGGFACALDNPIIAGMQGLLFINGLLFLVSLLLVSRRLAFRRPALPSWCRAYSVAALAVHCFWLLMSILVVVEVAGSAYDDVFAYLVSPEFLLVAAPSLLGFALALRVRHHAAPDWAPSLALQPSTAPGPTCLPPRA
jgi:hypothetical protein